MTRRDPQFPAMLKRWLDALDQRRDEGFRVGVRERLTALEWVRIREASATDPLDARELLRGIRSILCTGPVQQRRYDELLERFLQEDGAAVHATGAGKADPAPSWQEQERREDRLRLAGAVAALVAVVVLAFALWPWNGSKPPPDEPQFGQTVSPATNAAGAFLGVIPNTEFRYVVGQRLVRDPSRDSRAARGAWLFYWLAGCCGIALAAWGVAWWRRRVYVRHARTDAEVEERVLRGTSGDGAGIPGDILRRVAVELRQRLSGTRSVIDVPGTVSGTAHRGGLLSVRWRTLRTTPEYVALIEQRTKDDLFAWLALRWVEALRGHGVAVEAFLHDGSPQRGVWRATRDEVRPDLGSRIPWREWTGSAHGARLLVFGEVPVPELQESNPGRAHGAPEWVTVLGRVHDKAWFTPLPMSAWGSAEMMADEAGFLVLPMQAESLPAAASWWNVGRPVLEWDDGWPSRYPVLVGRHGRHWATRHSPPDGKTRGELVAQLRAYLGPDGFQWLCACAVFPGLSAGLARGLAGVLGLTGRMVDTRLSALASLPFFRAGFMPGWLREDLVQQLEPRHQRPCSDWLNHALGVAAFDPAEGGLDVVARMHVPMRGIVRRVRAWLRGGGGTLRDVVLVEFLHPGHFSRLARRLPEVVRRGLFREGSPAMGFRHWVLGATAALGFVAALLPMLLPGRTVVGYRQVPTRWETNSAFTNGLGMVFMPVPHAGVWFSSYETRVRDYQPFAEANPQVNAEWKHDTFGTGGLAQSSCPVVNVSWNEARQFCEWLTRREREARRLPAGLAYRLPTDMEWSAAVGLPKETGATPEERDSKIPDVFPWGTSWPPPNYTGNFADEAVAVGPQFKISGYLDAHPASAPVGSYPVLDNGLHDLSGNVWEWCEDWYDTGQKYRVVRGGSWRNGDRASLLSSYRGFVGPDVRFDYLGFRVVLGVEGSTR